MFTSGSEPPAAVAPTAATAMIVLGAVCFGLAPLFAKSLTEAGTASVAIVFFRYMTSALVLLTFLRLARERRPVTLWAIME